MKFDIKKVITILILGALLSLSPAAAKCGIGWGDTVTVETQDPKGNRSLSSNPITYRFHQPPEGSSWKLGDALSCGSAGCSCSTLGY